MMRISSEQVGKWAGILIAIGITILSCVINARYGLTLAKDDFDKLVMVGVAICADGGKALSWLYFASALKRREFLPAVVSLCVFCACLSYALAGSLGFASMSRATSSSDVANVGRMAMELDAEIERKRLQLANLGTTDPQAVLLKRIEAMKQDRRFAASAACIEATRENSRSFCADLARLEAEEKKAEAARELEDVLGRLREKRDAMGSVVHVPDGDLQSAILVQLTNLKPSTIQLSLAVLVVLVVELSTCFFFWLATNYGDGAQRAMTDALSRSDHAVSESVVLLGQSGKPDDFVQFIDRYLDVSQGAETNVDEIARVYRQWCATAGRVPLSDSMFALGVDHFCRVGGITRTARDGTLYLVGVSMTRTALLSVSRG